ncbi:bifunctional phosphopantothenoylcysteine decarboxylase/phosphopantothenate--cysteine ligase CoaBC [Thermospira aquatica]|uniref:Coenzyme A biosynthesis bifunctional protein CoaBC n=1 Tax=Thermospira aquatica TaxID=2828656 RepID=A0AAX3BD11_9SPIR|nr:bifunctional phosphopantothenoylcysteine decarboxylase/phosphopantothenate--cysteine ligase CoaBC [Thermospira aquatica]URA10177.1 bifunctional phosphopantothenoylcysteine decarboxylase/phosphopantothenate--cysteine ligase CoaBC [Thermospira aquatica]
MRIVFGISGGIAAYKVVSVIRRLVQRGHEVEVVMTSAAARLVSPFLLQTLTRRQVWVEDFDARRPLAHIELGDWCDVMVLAPATANTLAKLAHGMADNLLTASFLACDKRRVLFPAMNVKMYANPLTQKNLQILRDVGYEVYEPEVGELACGYQGKGRLPDEKTIVGLIDRDPMKPLEGMRVIVTTGATVEPIDPVRYISNFSSGKMGIALARRLFFLGASVFVVAGKTDVAVPSYLPVQRVTTTEDMLQVLQRSFSNYDVLVMAAAPADFRVSTVADTKIKREKEFSLQLIPNPDILAHLRQDYPQKQMIGFALEMRGGESHAKEKLKRKGLDAIVLNMVSPEFHPMGSDENEVYVYTKDGKEYFIERNSKEEVVKRIIDFLFLGVGA